MENNNNNKFILSIIIKSNENVHTNTGQYFTYDSGWIRKLINGIKECDNNAIETNDYLSFE